MSVTIIVTDIYVHSLVELKIIKKCTVPLLGLMHSKFKARGVTFQKINNIEVARLCDI